MRNLTIILLLFSLTGQAQNKPDITYKIIEASFITLNAIDLGTTIHGLNKGAIEGNPIIKHATPTTIAATKIVTTGGIVILHRMLYKRDPKAAKISMACFSILSGLVVTNNIIVIVNINK